MKPLLRQFVKLALSEARLRETDDVELHGGTNVKYGSPQYVADLKRRINELELWRSKQDRGSEVRANYSRLIARLKQELKKLEMRGEKKKKNSEPPAHHLDG